MQLLVLAKVYINIIINQIKFGEKHNNNSNFSSHSVHLWIFVDGESFKIFCFIYLLSFLVKKRASNCHLNLKQQNNFTMNESRRMRIMRLLLHGHFLWLLESSSSLTLCIYTVHIPYHKVRRLGHVIRLLQCNAAFSFPFHDFYNAMPRFLFPSMTFDWP